MSRKAQSSMEFLGVVLVGLLLFVPLFFIAMDFLSSKSFETSLSQARLTTTSLANAADTICLQAQGSKTEVIVPIPASLDNDNSSISNRTIKFALKNRERQEFVTATTKCDINGTLPSRAGTYIFEVKREASIVNITQKAS